MVSVISRTLDTSSSRTSAKSARAGARPGLTRRRGAGAAAVGIRARRIGHQALGAAPDQPKRLSAAGARGRPASSRCSCDGNRFGSAPARTAAPGSRRQCRSPRSCRPRRRGSPDPACWSSRFECRRCAWWHPSRCRSGTRWRDTWKAPRRSRRQTAALSNVNKLLASQLRVHNRIHRGQIGWWPILSRRSISTGRQMILGGAIRELTGMHGGTNQIVIGTPSLFRAAPECITVRPQLEATRWSASAVSRSASRRLRPRSDRPTGHWT